MGVFHSKSHYEFIASRTPQTTVLDWIAYEDMQVRPSATKTLTLINAIGRGSFSHIFLAQHESSKKYCTVKFIPKEHIFDTDSIHKVQNEIDILQYIKSDFITSYLSSYETPSCIGIVFEFIYAGELSTRLETIDHLSEREAMFYFCEIIVALQYLHTVPKILHRDLTPQNILIDNNGHIKICDFTSAILINLHDRDNKNYNYKPKEIQEVLKTHDIRYMSPEMKSCSIQKDYVFRTDYYSLGCILYEMLIGEIPDDDIEGHVSRLPLFMSSPCKKLIRHLIMRIPEKRWDYDTVMLSTWLADVDWEHISDHRIVPPWIPISATVPNTKYFKTVEDPIDTLSSIDPKVDFYCKKIRYPAPRRAPSINKIDMDKHNTSLSQLDDYLNGNTGKKLKTRKKAMKNGGNINGNSSSKLSRNDSFIQVDRVASTSSLNSSNASTDLDEYRTSMKESIKTKNPFLGTQNKTFSSSQIVPMNSDGQYSESEFSTGSNKRGKRKHGFQLGAGRRRHHSSSPLGDDQDDDDMTSDSDISDDERDDPLNNSSSNNEITSGSGRLRQHRDSLVRMNSQSNSRNMSPLLRRRSILNSTDNDDDDLNTNTLNQSTNNLNLNPNTASNIGQLSRNNSRMSSSNMVNLERKSSILFQNNNSLSNGYVQRKTVDLTTSGTEDSSNSNNNTNGMSSLQNGEGGNSSKKKHNHRHHHRSSSDLSSPLINSTSDPSALMRTSSINNLNQGDQVVKGGRKLLTHRLNSTSNMGYMSSNNLNPTHSLLNVTNSINNLSPSKSFSNQTVTPILKKTMSSNEVKGARKSVKFV